MSRVRLDTMLVERGLAESHERAQRVIGAGEVRVNGQRIIKPSHECRADDGIEVIGAPAFVGRGGDKLSAALEHFDLEVRDATCLDVGSSTGGFTDCLLQSGADRVYAVDVGRGQLHWRLRNDDRVVCMEGINARYLQPDQFPCRFDCIVIDVAFISLTRILPAVRDLLKPEAALLTLIKPQFEAERNKVERGGVVRDELVHQEVIEKIRKFGTASVGLEWCGVVPSALKGPAGNIEFFAYWRIYEDRRSIG